MSRLGKTSIVVPQDVEVKISPHKEIAVKGPKGSLFLPLIEGINLKFKDNLIHVEFDKKKLPYSFYGLYRSLINNIVIGVAQGFEKKLHLVGVGFRATVRDNKLHLQVGFSQEIILDIPKGIEVKVERSNEVTILGIDKRAVGQFAAVIRAFRPPEPYKGKGIRYTDEYVRRKAGKAAKTK